MKIPKSIKVGGMTYQVKQNHKFLENSDLMGQAVHCENIIRLSGKTQSNTNYAKDKMDSCFIHEVLHAIDNVYNNSNLDEPTIERFSQGIYQVFTDNKIF